MSENMVRAAKPFCGIREKCVSKSWVIGHRGHIRDLMTSGSERHHE